MGDLTEKRNLWNEKASQEFMDYGRYLVPGRETQLQLISQLIPSSGAAFEVMDLACGEGLLAEAILQQHPQAIVHGYDGSPAMLARAQARLAAFGPRFFAHKFNLFDYNWRQVNHFVHAVVSSLAIHHLDGGQKQILFNDIFHMLHHGGVLLIADLVQPASVLGTAVAAQAWDEVVKQRSLALSGSTDAFDFFVREKWNIFTYPEPMDKPSGLFEQLQWLAAAGFTAVDIYWMQAGHAIYGGCKA
jgi:tRNA (cmo5U34)-methyltransferase